MIHCIIINISILNNEHRIQSFLKVKKLINKNAITDLNTESINVYIFVDYDNSFIIIFFNFLELLFIVIFK